MTRKLSPINWLQASFAVVALLATAWLLWPQPAAQQGGNLPAFFVPTATATITRAAVQRMPTSTPFNLTATPQPVIHVIQPGDVLGIIAKEYGVTEKAIMEANGLKSDLIIDGHRLIIPEAKRTPVVCVWCTPTVITPLPTSTPTSAFHYLAPVLLSPYEGAAFHGREARVALQWTSVGILQDGEWYEVKLWSQKQGQAYALRFYIQATSWLVPADAYPGDAGDVMYWVVAVVYRGRRTIPLSPAASARRFSWY